MTADGSQVKSLVVESEPCPESETIPVEWSELVRFPQELMLPMALVKLNGGLRKLVIREASQTVAKGIVAWMRGDSRYRGWFA